MKRKSLKPWVLAIVAPITILFFTVFLQIIVRLSLLGNNGTNEGAILFINLFSLTFGTLAVLLLLGLPLWIIMLMKAIQYNSKIKTAPNPPQNTAAK
jgi:chromate transport protein ChrA